MERNATDDMEGWTPLMQPKALSLVEPRPAGGESVVDRIKEYILTNRLAPGDPLPTENELSEQLKVSRSRIREAVKTLSALDIVEVRHGYGTYVGRMSFSAMVESLAFRGMLEGAPKPSPVLIRNVDHTAPSSVC